MNEDVEYRPNDEQLMASCSKVYLIFFKITFCCNCCCNLSNFFRYLLMSKHLLFGS